MSKEAPAPTLDRRICELVDERPAAEEVLDRAGVDYWFGWERELRSACDAANVDADELAAQLAKLPLSPGSSPPPVSLTALLVESDRHAKSDLLPAIERTFKAAQSLPDEGGREVQRLLETIRSLFRKHMQSADTLLPDSRAIDQKAAEACVDPTLLRRLRLDHLELARLSKELTRASGKLPVAPQTERCRTGAHQVVHGIHRHIRTSYNFIIPRLVTSLKRRQTLPEPW